jgi:AAA domain
MNFAELVLIGRPAEDYTQVDSGTILKAYADARECVLYVWIALEHQLSLLEKEFKVSGPSEAVTQIAERAFDIAADHTMLVRRIAAIECEVDRRTSRNVVTSENPLVRPLTKNLIQAPEKAFKTTFLMRLTMGISTGETVFPSLPVRRGHRVLYLHGELAPAELKQRIREAAVGLKRPLDNFFQGRSLNANLLTREGQNTIMELGKQYEPQLVAIDPWQSFIPGADENVFKDVSIATAYLDELISECRVTIFLAIHEGKDSSRGARGHSSLAGWRDTLFTLRRKGTTLTVGVEPRWASPPADLNLTFRGGTLWEGDGPRWTKQDEKIRALLMANNCQLTRDQVGFGLELEDSALRMALKRAHEHQAIELDGESVRLPARSSPPASPNQPF